MARILLALLMVGLLGASTSALAKESSKSASSPVAMTVEMGYHIGPGDVLDVSVWKDETLTRSCIVRPDGFISFPLIGDVSASGKTVPELKAEMEGKLKRFVPEVVLFIDVKQVNSLIIYVIGKVNNPGRIILGVDVDVLQALAIAGGLNTFAKGSKIRIFRLGNSNETTIFYFDYDEVVNGKHLEQNIFLKRGDVVVVP